VTAAIGDGEEAAPAATSPDAVATVDTQAETRIDAVSGAEVGAAGDAPAAPAAVPAAGSAPPATASSASAAPASPATSAPAPTPMPTPSASSTAPPPAAATSGRFLVGLGSYANSANANALAAQLRGAGFKVLSDTVVVNGQNATRLRIGPYATRGQAEAARLAVKRVRADLPAAISEADDTPASDAPATARSAVTTSVWAVQIGAFKLDTEANAKRDQLRQAGFAAFVEKVNAEGGPLFRVRIGPENRRADAEAVKAGVKRSFGIDGIVVPYP
jgi:DedD protein